VKFQEVPVATQCCVKVPEGFQVLILSEDAMKALFGQEVFRGLQHLGNASRQPSVQDLFSFPFQSL